MRAQFKANGKTVTINASMETLNEILGMSTCKARYCREKGHEDAEKIYDDWSYGIYNALDAKGFYDDVKEE